MSLQRITILELAFSCENGQQVARGAVRPESERVPRQELQLARRRAEVAEALAEAWFVYCGKGSGLLGMDPLPIFLALPRAWLFSPALDNLLLH